MTSFIDQFPHAVIMSTLGDEITYKRKLQKINLKAEVDLNAQYIGNDAIVVENRTEIEFLKSDLPFMPAKGDSISYFNQTYSVELLIKNDEKYYRVVVKKQ